MSQGRKEVSEYFGVMRGPTVEELPALAKELEEATAKYVSWRDHRFCAVVMAAHQARRRWLEEAVRSVRAQEPLPGWVYYFMVGVDGCEDTSALLLELEQPHWFSPTNVGPYVIRNSLIEKVPAAAVAIFDADDVMHPTYLRTLIPLAMKHGVAGAARRTIDAVGRVALESRKGRRQDKVDPYGTGVAVISSRVLEAAGGFKPWAHAADHDFSRRVDALGFRRLGYKKPLFDRRRHVDQLHNRVGDAARRAAVNRATAELEQGVLRVEPVTTPLEWRSP